MSDDSITVPVGQFSSLNQDKPPFLMICANNEALVTIEADGTLVYGPNYNPDEAARIFWEAVAAKRPPYV